VGEIGRIPVDILYVYIGIHSQFHWWRTPAPSWIANICFCSH